MQHIPDALAPLADYCQWVLWKAVPSTTRPGKVDKFPCSLRGEVIDAHNPAHWLSAADAIAHAARLGLGVGFVFTSIDPFFFVDIDDCLEDSGNWSPIALELCGWFNGAAVEVSHSGRGLHIIGSGSHAAPEERKKKGPGFDIYTEGRFVALTGERAIGHAGTDHSAALAAVCDRYLKQAAAGGPAEWTDEPAEGWNGPTDDEELVRRAMNARSASVFGGKATFRDLWEANADALARSYPDDHNGREYDASQADAALAQHLAFWTGNDCTRIERLMRASDLARDKWDLRPDYLERTILRAVGLQKDVCGKSAREPLEPLAHAPPAPTGGHSMPGAQLVDGFQYLAGPQMIEYFKNCVYIRDMHRVFVPDGAFLEPAQFKTMYGGCTFAMDPMGEKTTRNAFEAFTESQAVRFPKAAAAVFRPERNPGELFTLEGLTVVNTYIPVETPAIEGDPAPFLDLLARMLPDERDRRILLSYLAACVQYKGRKFQWWPVLQGTKGNGKTLIISAMRHAISDRYSFAPNVDEIAKSGNKFNSWVRNRLFIAMEEVYVAERRDFLNAFKTTITNEWLPVEAKGVDQAMCDNRANGVMCTNYRAGVPIDNDERRYCIFYTAQQSAEDLKRDGMTGDYFPALYDWAKGQGRHADKGEGYGFSIINHYLQNYEIDEEFNPAGRCQIAPVTTSTAQAVEESRGAIEQMILEAVGEDRPGFAGGFISSAALDQLLEQMRVGRQVPPNKRRDLLRTLGYDWHPALKEGRTTRAVMPDGRKIRLYVRNDSLVLQLTDPHAIARRYTEAQTAAQTGDAAAVFSKV